VVLFQALVLSRWTFLYPIIKILFAAIALLAVAALFKKLAREKRLILCLLLILLIRLPFYFHPQGLITTSDNAMEALQSLEMQDTHTAPFFLLEHVKHMGTIKYLWGAFLNDFFGASYLPFALLQLAIFIAFLFAVNEIFSSSIEKNVLFLFLLGNFAFIETCFDYSLSIRGAPYLEMILFFVLGVALFDFSFQNKGRIFLAYYFIFFSIYIHPLSALFVFSFVVCTMIYAIKNRRMIHNVAAIAAGALGGLSHWFYYLLFKVKPVSTGAWERMDILPLSRLSLHTFRSFGENFWQIFRNIFNYEFSYFHDAFPGGKVRIVLFCLNQVVIYLSLTVLAVALVMVLRKILRLLQKKDELQIKNWTDLFYFFLLGSVLVKIFLFYPPHQEPRHNFDLMFLVMASYLIVFSSLFKGTSVTSWRTIAAIVLLVALTVPHAYYFWENAQSKAASYRELMSALDKNNVRYLDADYIIAFCVYYFSQRKILVSDSLGPFSVKDFYPELRARVDQIPQEKKAFLFFSESYPSRPWHKKATAVIQTRLLDRFKKAGIPVRVVRLKDYVLIVPSPRT